MVKNNIISLFIHFIISALCIIIFMFFHMSVAKWVSAEAARKHHINMMTAAVLVMVIALFLYYFLSRKFCKDQGSSFKNLMSISITLIIGTFLWITAFSIDLTNGTNILLNSELWSMFGTYYSYCLFLVDETRIGNPYVMLIFLLLPIFAMRLGIKNTSSSTEQD